MRNLLYVGLTMLVIYFAFEWLLESPPAQILLTEDGQVVILTADRSGHFVGAGSIKESLNKFSRTPVNMR